MRGNRDNASATVAAHANLQTKVLLTDRMSIRLPANYADIHGKVTQHSAKLDRPPRRTLIFPFASFATRVLLRFPPPED